MKFAALYNFIQKYMLFIFPAVPRRIIDFVATATNMSSMTIKTLYLYHGAPEGIIVSKNITVASASVVGKRLPQGFIVYAEYNHPELQNPIIFDKINKYLLTGNDLFSAEFILRYLEFYCNNFVFDTRYTMTVMDNNIKLYELSYKDYLQMPHTPTGTITLLKG
jgi:hypothetical protein